MVALWVLYIVNNFPDLLLEEFRAHYAIKNSLNCEGSYYFQSFTRQVINNWDDHNKTWKDYWFWVRCAWEAPPLVLKTFGHLMSTTWNLNWQCVDSFEVTDDVLLRLLIILEMSGKRKNYQAFIQSEVLNFVGWFCFRAKSSISIALSTLS